MWEAVFDPLTAPGPYTITASVAGSCSGQIQLTDVLAGDVYICSGQSNMQFQMTEVLIF